MKTKLTTALVIALGALALAANAQDTNNDGPPPGGQGQHGPGKGQRPPPPAIVRALDANHDGVIDSNEIANASAALKTLDKNGDGKLTPDEFMGPRPPMRGGHQGQGKHPGGDNNQPPSGPPPGDSDNNTPPAGPPPSDN